MAELKFVILSDAVFVTTPAHAKTLWEEEGRRQGAKGSAPQPGGLSAAEALAGEHPPRWPFIPRLFPDERGRMPAQ
jgi:hypothetical protein